MFDDNNVSINIRKEKEDPIVKLIDGLLPQITEEYKLNKQLLDNRNKQELYFLLDIATFLAPSTFYKLTQQEVLEGLKNRSESIAKSDLSVYRKNELILNLHSNYQWNLYDEELSKLTITEILIDHTFAVNTVTADMVIKIMDKVEELSSDDLRFRLNGVLSEKLNGFLQSRQLQHDAENSRSHPAQDAREGAPQ